MIFIGGAKQLLRCVECRTRAEEAAEAETTADRVRIQEILGQLQMQANGTRREAIGFDRHWNRYWILGSFGPDEPGAPPSYSASFLALLLRILQRFFSSPSPPDFVIVQPQISYCIWNNVSSTVLYLDFKSCLDQGIFLVELGFPFLCTGRAQ